MEKQLKVTDILISEIDLLRKKIEALVQLLDEKRVVTRDEVETKLKSLSGEAKVSEILKIIEKLEEASGKK